MDIKEDWIEKGLWVLPSRTKYLLNKSQGKRENHHIVDITHILSHRSFVAGFMEGNTSTTRPWFRLGHPDKELNAYKPVKEFTQTLTDRCLSIGTSSNLYHALAQAYSDFGCFDTACIYIDELEKGPQFNVLTPGAYFLMNDNTGTANVLVREIPMTIKNIVDNFGKKINGKWDWSNFSDTVKNLYEAGAYTTTVTIIETVMTNKFFDNDLPEAGSNRKWVSLIYEAKGYDEVSAYGKYNADTLEDNKFLKIQYRTRKPFIAFRSTTSNNFAYGERGPTTDSLGLIKSLNKKAIAKDVALDLMLRPPLQGPASLKKSYVTTNPQSYISLDPQTVSFGGAKPVFEVNPAIAALNQDVDDLRNMVRKMYYEDFMLFLTHNPKTRTAAEVNAITSEQQLVIGPMLQSLDYTLNVPLTDYLADYALFEDPYLPPIPKELEGESLRTTFISVFAQAQRAADLPSIDRYIAMITNVGQINPQIFDKANLDKLADLYEDRLYLPAGLNRDQKEVDARRDKNMRDAQRQQMMNETIPNMASASKDLSAAQLQEQQLQGV